MTFSEGGTGTVATSAVRRESLVFLTLTALRCGTGGGGGCGFHHAVTSRVVGDSFTVSALDLAGGVARGDDSTLAWVIVDVVD